MQGSDGPTSSRQSSDSRDTTYPRRRARSEDLSLGGTSQKQDQLRRDCVLAGILLEVCKQSGFANPDELREVFRDYKGARSKVEKMLKVVGSQKEGSSEEPQTLVARLNKVSERQSASDSRENSWKVILRDGAALTLAGFAGLHLLRLGLHKAADRL